MTLQQLVLGVVHQGNGAGRIKYVAPLPENFQPCLGRIGAVGGNSPLAPVGIGTIEENVIELITKIRMIRHD
jgi:hypothetical protein